MVYVADQGLAPCSKDDNDDDAAAEEWMGVCMGGKGNVARRVDAKGVFFEKEKMIPIKNHIAKRITLGDEIDDEQVSGYWRIDACI
jgi:hypothetical protein